MIHAKSGPTVALKVRFRKLIAPADVPLRWGGFASLATVYVSIAAPEAMPATRPTTYGGNTPGRPYRIQARHARRTHAPPAITGFRRPIRSESRPSNGQPMIQPRGTVDERITASA